MRMLSHDEQRDLGIVNRKGGRGFMSRHHMSCGELLDSVGGRRLMDSIETGFRGSQFSREFGFDASNKLEAKALNFAT